MVVAVVRLGIDENRTRDKFKHERLHAVLLFANLGRDRLERLAISKLRHSAEGERGELVRQILHDEVFALLHQFAELLEAGESPHAGPFIGGSDRWTIAELGASTRSSLNERR